MAIERSKSPPRKEGTLPPNPATPEQIRRIEEARLRAKALRERDEAAARISSGVPATVAGQKRPHAAISKGSVPQNSRDGRSSETLALSRTTSEGMSRPPVDDAIRPARKYAKDNYIEYDFSTMTDTKGGFLSAVDDPQALARSGVEDPSEQKPAHMTMAEWERAQLLKKLRLQRQGPFEPGISSLDKDSAQKTCRECGSLEIDWTWLDIFKVPVCNNCKEKLPDKYSLLTKTEAREDYLLTNPELQDKDLFGWIERPNPHKSTWNSMQLYLRCQVEDYAFSSKRWGSAEALDAEFEKRESEKSKRKEKKFKSRLEELKRRTMVEAYKRDNNVREKAGPVAGGVRGGDGSGKGPRHIHEWGRPVHDPETGMMAKRCTGCGQEVEELEL